MKSEDTIRQLDDNTALRVLSHLTQRLRETMTPEQRGAVVNMDEARRAMASFIETYGAKLTDSEIKALGSNGSAGLAPGAALGLMMDDPAVNDCARDLISNPPDDTQRSVELALSGAIILGGLIGWLQTKVEIQVSRKNRETEFHFSLKKNSSSEGSLKAIAQGIRALLVR